MQIEDCWMNGIGKLSEPCASYEGILQARWNRIPLNTPLRMPNRKTLVVLSRGIWNFESGPDFRSAKIMVDHDILTGDVEVHESDRDWVRHGYHRNPAYSNVILHVVERAEGTPFTGLPVYLLPPEEAISSAPPPLTSVKGKCLEKYALLEPGKVREMFIQAGLERMHQRSLLILHDMIKNGMTNAFLNRLFDSCGFKRNRAAFRSLLGRLLEKYTEEEFTSFFEPLIWGESGLLPAGSSGSVPEELVENAKTIWERWWYLRKDSPEPVKWNRDGGRPLNSPERRIAGLCLFLRKFGMNPLPLWLHKLRTASSAVVFSKELLASLILNDDFWNSHTTFRAGRLKYPAAVVGGEKARELAVDIIMPSLRAAAMLEKDEKMMDRIDAVFRNLPKTQKNRVLITALDKWFDDPDAMAKTLSDAASRQGVLQLYSNYCLKISCDCNVCLINNTMFSR